MLRLNWLLNFTFNTTVVGGLLVLSGGVPGWLWKWLSEKVGGNPSLGTSGGGLAKAPSTIWNNLSRYYDNAHAVMMQFRSDYANNWISALNARLQSAQEALYSGDFASFGPPLLIMAGTFVAVKLVLRMLLRSRRKSGRTGIIDFA